MRTGFEFTFYVIGPADAAIGSVDPTLALMGAQGWELRGIAFAPDGSLVAGLQRRLDEEHPLPDSATLAATLDEPLVGLRADDLEGAASA